MKKSYKKVLSIFILCVLLILSFLIIRPFVNIIFTSFIFVYIFHPIYRFLKKWIKNDKIRSAFMCICIIILIIIPIFFMLNTMLRQIPKAYNEISSKLDVDSFDMISGYLKEKLGLTFDLADVLSSITSFIINLISNFLSSLPNHLLNIFILVLLMYYLFIDGEKLIIHILPLIPLTVAKSKKIMEDLHKTIFAVVFGHLLTALLQAIIALIGYVIFGIESPLFLAVLTLISSSLPAVGAPIVYIPLTSYMILIGYLDSDYMLVFKGIGLLLYSLLIVSSVDNIVKPKLISDKSNIHPAIVLLGVFGGIFLFGFIGIAIGPIILILFVNVLSMLKE